MSHLTFTLLQVLRSAPWPRHLVALRELLDQFLIMLEACAFFCRTSKHWPPRRPRRPATADTHNRRAPGRSSVTASAYFFCWNWISPIMNCARAAGSPLLLASTCWYSPRRLVDAAQVLQGPAALVERLGQIGRIGELLDQRSSRSRSSCHVSPRCSPGRRDSWRSPARSAWARAAASAPGNPCDDGFFTCS